jgi:hypothetical protein
MILKGQFGGFLQNGDASSKCGWRAILKRKSPIENYNLVRVHKSLRVTPAMAAGVENRLWSIEELLERTSA